jgi:multiple sugar transport system substrate-binding protein
MTHNATISIAAKWLDDMNNATLTEAQRATAKKNYTELIATAGFPNKPDGSEDDLPRGGEDRRDLQGRQEQGGGQEVRRLPARRRQPHAVCRRARWAAGSRSPRPAQQSPFWKADPHRLAVYNQFMAGTTPFEFTKNYKFTVLNNENVWAKAMNRVLSEKVPVDKAVDEMIARIKTVAN